MEINKECVRDILLYVKEYCVFQQTTQGKHWHEVSFDELCKSEKCSKYGMESIFYVIDKLSEYNLINLSKIKFKSNIDSSFKNIHINSLTARGHEFIDNLSNDDVWDQVKTAINNAGINDCSLNMYFKYIYDEIEKRLNNK